MKRIFSVLLMLFVGVFLLSACAAQGFVQLPEDVTSGISMVVALAVSWVFARLILLIPFLKFLEPYRTPLTLAVSAEVIVLIQNAIPTGYDDVAATGFRFLLAIFAVVFGVLKYLQIKQFRAFK